MKPVVRVVARAFLLAALASVVGLLVNLLRPHGLGLVADESYQIYVPCPVITKEAETVEAGDLPADLAGFVIVDARSGQAYAKARIAGARSIPFSPLESPAPNLIAELRSSRATGILVYGDVEIDSGRLLGAELAGAGLRGVRYLRGGFEAWVASGRPVESGGGS